MDQETPKDPDKRNWRERLGIGTTLPASTPAKDLPRIGEDYRKVTPAPIAPRSPASTAPRALVPRALPPKVELKVAPSVKPAPMAPRPAAKAPPPRPTTPAVSPEKLAERLRAQRDASEKFAEQRIQVAKQRAEQAQLPVPSVAPPKPVSPPRQVAANAKPKFSFAEEDASPTVAPVVQQRTIVPPAAPPPIQVQPAQVNVQPTVATPQLAPARPPLGTAPGGYQQPRPQQPYQQPNVQQPYFPQQQPYGNNGNGGFAASNYRPIDPATGYPVQPQQYGQQPYGAPPMQRPYGAPAGNYQQQPAPRLGMPSALPGGMQQRPGINPNYAPPGEPGATPPQQGMNPGFGLEARGAGQLNSPAGGPGLSPLRANRPPLRTPSNPGPVLYDDQPNDELFEEPASRGPRRAATDYQQAYREVEAGYDDEAPRNKGPWILLGLLLLALAAAFAGVWYYTTTIKPLMSQSTSEQQQLPVVEAPDTAAKVAPDRSLTAAETPGAPTKKQIYDRIVGDREVLKGDVVPTEEVPLAPDAALPLPVPDPVLPAGDAGQTPTPLAPAGDSSDPLPIPAPPGDPSPQGSLEEAPNKQSSEVISPAAGESQAAVAAPPPLDVLKPLTPVAPETPTVPEDVASTDTKTPDAIETPTPSVETEAIADTPETAGLPSPKLRKIEAAPKPKKIIAKKEIEKDLGASPVVLVPVNKQAKVAPKKLAKLDNSDIATNTTGDSLFEVGGNSNAQVTTPPVVEPPTQQAPAKKKKTLIDLLNGTDTTEVQQPVVAETTVPKPVTPPAKIIAPKVAPKPVEDVQVASNNGFVAQLASFRSKAEATAEFGRLRSKHASTFQGASAIISEAEVGGSTRFRLNVGGMDSKAAADAFCSKLFAGGERDCLVRKR